MMRYRLTLEFINLFFAGILAGMEIAAHYGFHAPTLALDEPSQIRFRQGVTLRLRWLIPCFFMPTALSGIALTILAVGASGAPFRGAALAAISIWILVRVVGTVRVNAAALDWNPEAPPQNWRELITKTERFHLAGTWAALLTFVFYLIAMALRLTSAPG